MNARRSSTKATIRLETLEDRITPVAIHPTLASLASMRGALLSHTDLSLQSGSAPHLNLPVTPGHRPLPVTVSTTTDAPPHKTPQRIHPSIGVVVPVGNPAPVSTPVVSQPVLRSFTLPSTPGRRPVAVPPSPVVPPTVPLDPNGGTTTPTSPPAGSTGNPPTPAPTPPFILR